MAMPMQDYELIRMKDHIEIKRASIEDAETILHLQMHAYLSEAEIYNDYSIPPLIQSLSEMKKEFSQQVFLNAIEEGKIVGSVRATLKKKLHILDD
jgi:hypothetical protein